jgi:aspartate aminotransferase
MSTPARHPALSKRADSLGTENAFVVLAEVNQLVRAGKNIISFCIGQPDFPTPTHIQDAAVAAVRGGKHGYTPSAGIDELRAAAAASMAKLRGIRIDPEDVVVGAGAKPFIAYAIASVTDHGSGDEVIYPVPGFPIYESQIRAHGAVPVPLELRESRHFAFDPAELEQKITPRTKMLILNTPHNPTGGLLSKTDLEAIAAVLRRHPQVWIYADEIYSKLVYDGQFASIAALPGMQERTIISDGASKTYAMTGWRIGFTANKALAPVFTRWITNTESCASQISQWATVAALEGPQDDVEAMVVEFKARRDLIVAGLNDIPGIRCATPVGAFYAFPDVSGTGLTGAEMAERLLQEAGVCVLAGTAFGGVGVEHVRISYANSRENLTEALGRIRGVVDGLGRG